MIVRLLVSNDKANVKKVVLRTDTVIGRSSDCNLRIASKEVSRKHCSIVLSDRLVTVRDLGSANGTFLNGSQIEANVDVPAPPGSELEVGNVRFVINYDAPVPAELEASTAEVPNAVLAARLARAAQTADVAQNVRPRAATGNQATVPRAAIPPPVPADSQMDTYRGSPADTLHESEETLRAETFNAADPDEDEADQTLQEPLERPVNDDTFALKESEAEAAAAAGAVAEASPAFPAVDETISMQAEDLLIDTGPTVPVARPEAAAKDTPKKGWKSVFGLFGGKKQPQPVLSVEKLEVDVRVEEAPRGAAPLRDDSNRLELAPDRAPDPERNRKTVPEFQLPPGDQDLEDNRQTLPEFELPAAEDDALDETIHFAADESVPPKSPGGQPPELAAGDTNLQDFFKNLSKE